MSTQKTPFPSTTSMRDWLLNRQRELLSEIEAGEAEATGLPAEGVVNAEVSDLKDQANRNERHTVQDAEIQRDREELAAVCAALARLDDGSYGLCIDCGLEISPARLQVMPSAARCIECQSRVEAH